MAQQRSIRAVDVESCKGISMSDYNVHCKRAIGCQICSIAGPPLLSFFGQLSGQGSTSVPVLQAVLRTTVLQYPSLADYPLPDGPREIPIATPLFRSS